MKPIGITEQLMFTTVRLAADNGSYGTGYFYNFQIDKKNIPVIVTNKHVVNNNPDETMTFLVHLTSNGEEEDGNYAVRLSTHWLFHPTKDMCLTYCASLNEEIPKLTGKHVFMRNIDNSFIWSKEKLTELSMSESVTMIGYPNGLWDQKHNFPIFRYGNTAAHPGYDFNEDGIGLVDMACFPGSSGSPVFIINEGSVKDKTGSLFLGESRVIFLGTLFSGPTIDAEGKIQQKTIPTSTVQIVSNTRMMMNLGYYIKSYELDGFRPLIEADMKRVHLL